MTTLSGILQAPDGTAIAGAKITFEAARNYEQVMFHASSSLTTGSNGSYSVTLPVGSYNVFINYGTNRIITVGLITILSGSVDGTLNDYLLTNNDPAYVDSVLAQLGKPDGVLLVNGAMDKAQNLNDVTNKVTARTNLDVYSTNESVVLRNNSGWGQAGSDTITDNKTPKLSLALPFAGNKLSADVARIIQALSSIDSTVFNNALNAESLKSILEFDSDDVNDDTSRFVKAIAACGAVHIPDRNQVIARLGRDLVVGNLVINKPFYIIGNSGQGIDSISSTITKKVGSAFCISFEGADNASILAGSGIRGVRMLGTEADTGVMVNSHFVSHLDLDRVSFNYFGGNALKLKRTMESSITNCYFRKIGGNGQHVIFIDSHEVGYPGNNVNNLHINSCTFGYNGGRWLHIADDANVDMLWFGDNKMEWDGTVTSPNATSTEVVYLGQLSRGWLTNNGFTYFNTADNKYDGGVIVLGSACTGEITIVGNKLQSCQGNWLDVRGGRVVAYKNSSDRGTVSGDVTISVTSSVAQDIEAIALYTNNRNVVAATPVTPSAMRSGHTLPSAISKVFIADASSLFYVKTVQQVQPSTEITRAIVPFAMSSKGFIHVTARVRTLTTSDASGTVSLYQDAVNLQSKSVVAASGWQYLTWQVKPGQITTTTFKLVNDSPATVVCFDGLSVTEENYIDWSFSWSPGSIAANGNANSPAQAPSDFLGMTGVMIHQIIAASADANSLPIDPGVIILQPRPLATGAFTIMAVNPTAAAITPGFSRIKCRLFRI